MRSRKIGLKEKSKRTKSKIRKYNKPKKALRFFLGVFCISLLGVFFSLTLFFSIEEVEAEQLSKYSKEQIIALSGIKKGDNLFLLDKKEKEKRIEKNLPYIKKALIKRRLPNKIIIKIKEPTIKYLIKKENVYIAVDEDYKVLECFDQRVNQGMLIKGLEVISCELGEILKINPTACFNNFKELCEEIKTKGLENITQLNLENITANKIYYEDRIEINLGVFEEIDYKLQTAKEIIQGKKIGEDESGVLNLSLLGDDNRSYFTPNDKSCQTKDT